MEFLSCLALCAIALGVGSCRPKGSPEQQATAQPSDLAAARPARSPDSLLRELIALEEAVRSKPGDLAARQALARAAWDSAGGMLCTAGWAVGESRGRTRIAQHEAHQWALYLRAWIGGDRRSYGDPIAGEVADSRILLERSDGDTSSALLQAPYARVSVK